MCRKIKEISCVRPRVYPHGVYATLAAAELAIVEYIEMIFNGERLHQALGYQTPNEVEMKYFDEQFELTAK